VNLINGGGVNGNASRKILMSGMPKAFKAVRKRMRLALNTRSWRHYMQLMMKKSMPCCPILLQGKWMN